MDFQTILFGFYQMAEHVFIADKRSNNCIFWS